MIQVIYLPICQLQPILDILYSCLNELFNIADTEINFIQGTQVLS